MASVFRAALRLCSWGAESRQRSSLAWKATDPDPTALFIYEFLREVGDHNHVRVLLIGSGIGGAHAEQARRYRQERRDQGFGHTIPPGAVAGRVWGQFSSRLARPLAQEERVTLNDH